MLKETVKKVRTDKLHGLHRQTTYKCQTTGLEITATRYAGSGRLEVSGQHDGYELCLLHNPDATELERVQLIADQWLDYCTPGYAERELARNKQRLLTNKANWVATAKRGYAENRQDYNKRLFWLREGLRHASTITACHQGRWPKHVMKVTSPFIVFGKGLKGLNMLQPDPANG